MSLNLSFRGSSIIPWLDSLGLVSSGYNAIHILVLLFEPSGNTSEKGRITNKLLHKPIG
jgi:hypothetical protein